MKVKSKCPPEQKKNVKYTETKKRINKIRRQLEKLEDIFKENKRINKICKQINKLEEKDFCETYTLIYDRDSTAKENPTNPKIMRDLDEAARIAIGYFSKTCSIRYYVADVIRATKYMCSGRVLCLTFTAKPQGSEKVQTFKTEIYYETGQTEVKYVQVVAT
ncbi:hypothetical protein ABFS82_14G064900 [Erythranthe guttata]|uniref:Uncharacterized protein n=1 Tax=Erythranthe guttata TaxID=4155 RepID=A0A022R978_ERYGU|nr:PREDICTED: uncharacterized protein LOC105958646 [Erythranthe guttata]EYU36912.1 hypothetical protein MIMGU_mgv1a015332mg [Erythranthe guttata]|eukprot:XP_012838114.1 PREDICTED: uncharacterized protein LOC105958646 [Erythranthe guttata]